MSDDGDHAITLNRLLDDRVAERGDATALIYQDRAISFTALAEQVRSVAAGLAALGIGPGDTVAVWLPNMPEWVVLEFALARLGAVAVAINTKFRKHEVEDILHRSAARLLVLSPQLGNVDYLSIVEQFDAASLDALEAFLLVDDSVAERRILGRKAYAYRALTTHAAHEADHGRSDSPCNVFTSSGTTSAPKLVLHRQSAITHHALAVAARFGYRDDADAVILGALPFCGVFGFDTIMGALAAGRPVVLMPAFDAAAAVEQIERHRVTHASGSDEMFRRIFMVAEPAARIASLKEGAFANFSADAAALVDSAQALGIKLFQTFGSSEVQALMTYAPAGSGPGRWAVGGGTPSSDETRVRVRDTETGELLPDGESGELEIAGPNVMVEYMHNTEANARAVTADGYVRTGDLGYIEGPDSFVYLARLGDTLRLGGFLVNPREIEAYLEGFDAIALAQVVAVDTERGPRPVAFVILEAGAAFDEAAIIDACQASMAKFKVPIRIQAIDAFPITSSANGEKIQKAKLREQAQALVDRQGALS
ncbi:AMP-binding protein [Salinisphaera aquimarina]|uniref:Long-chain-fatty-acid--CoA ligase n=1 Tax=Salinisphaera aquimarina TaxID=2094031 RepID=A0ABV7ELP4_9GAMM